MQRRAFVGATGSALLSVGLAPAIHLRAPYDLVIRHGTLFDGTGRPGVAGDLALRGGRIAAMGRVSEKGSDEIDAKGLAVAPGFLDIHSHGGGSLDADPRAESLIRQGITTIVEGQDGSSSGLGGERSFAAYFAGLDALHPAVNVASMVGLGSMRGVVVGDDNRPATANEMARMVALVEQALKDGACGASSGLEYTPGGFASPEELVALCRPLATRRLPYATHMRNEDDRVLESIDESIAVAAGAKCPLQISHLKTQGPRNWGKLNDAFARVERAKRGGLDIAFDRYPYVAYSTGLSNLFPVATRDGGTDAFLKRLVDPASAPRAREDALAKVALIGGWDNVMITSVRAPEDKGAEGQRLGTYAQAKGADPYQLTVDLLTRNRGSVGMVGFAMSEENLDRILAHPLGMVCSDGGAYAVEGPARRGSPHPRGLGTFPRVLGRYVRERKALTLAQAIHKMTAFPAARLRLADRGCLAIGLAGDVVVFDPATVADTATFENPFQYPVGIAAVVVNGTPALRDGARVGTGQGRSLPPA